MNKSPIFITQLTTKDYTGQVAFYPKSWPESGSTKGGMHHSATFFNAGLEARVLSATKGEDALKADWHGSQLREGEASEKFQDTVHSSHMVPEYDDSGNRKFIEKEVSQTNWNRDQISQDSILALLGPNVKCEFLDKGRRYMGVRDGQDCYQEIVRNGFMESRDELVY